MKRLAGLVAALALLVALPASAQAATCTPPKYPGSGYFTSLKATKVSCGEASKVALAFHKCRTKKGVSGRCVSKVRKYACNEKRTTISTEINGRVTCKYGSRKVELTYQQNT
ncbi:hypothetical protein OJ997_23955 [Solirubrobacter phytolaccae]|uniref:Uncharacterized protein n=1 Tax=Solirubrobacter phytolaccae TaxID=1404360 RepID=A0A9X3NG17_9ACTN|nr:hypothetical protein [Solirubrobacter phytolaccae]MDA0183386.1 hypothetical protein [Solirubrobacter phytolaccae]